MAANRIRDVVRQRIRSLRLERGLTQEGLCQRAEISVDAVSRIEGGSRVPTIDTVEKVAHALGVSIEELLRSAPPQASKHRPAVRRVVTLLETEPPPVQDAVEEIVRAVVRVIGRSQRRRRG